MLTIIMFFLEIEPQIRTILNSTMERQAVTLHSGDMVENKKSLWHHFVRRNIHSSGRFILPWKTRYHFKNTFRFCIFLALCMSINEQTEMTISMLIWQQQLYTLMTLMILTTRTTLTTSLTTLKRIVFFFCEFSLS